jgi:stress-induced morphogen
MSPLEEIKNLIEGELAGSAVEVGDMTGTGDHLEILVVSDDFKGKLLLEQHQMVMDILKESLKEKVHAVKIKTITKEKYNQQG